MVVSPSVDQAEVNPYSRTREYRNGWALAHPPPGDEVIISGIAGSFPNCKNIYEFRDNLTNKIDMVSEGTRWDFDHPKMPQRFGKVPGIEKYDSGFFGTHYRQAMSMSPMGRMFFERVLEAVFDAGINPAELEGTRTAVLVVPFSVDTDQSSYAECPCPESYAFTGTIRSMIANKISYFLRLNGSSSVLDTACNSSLQAIQVAYEAIRRGDCDSAIVGGNNLSLHPYFSLGFANLGVLGPDGKCKSFDASANGYVRAEAVCALLLQKAKDARRVYCRVVHTKTNCDGFKSQGITFPSRESQRQLFEELYLECGIKPSILTYMEAHGPGTKIGDAQELYSIGEVFCKNRGAPLPIGSVKSNCGHSEGSSGITSIAKVIVSMECGSIAPTLHYQSPIEGGEAIKKGLMKVVTENMPIDTDLCTIGINNFGYGGVNSHMLLTWNEKRKSNAGLPNDDLPRIVCVSGRTKDAISAILDDVKCRKLDAEFVNLLQQLFKTNIVGHCNRGYAIFSKESGEIKRSKRCHSFDRKPMYILFGGEFGNPHKMAKDLYEVQLFANSLDRVHDVLLTKGINGKRLVLSGKCLGFSSGFITVMSNAIVQIGVVDVLKALNLRPEGYFGCGSIGEFICGYYDGVLDLEEVVFGILYVATTLSDCCVVSYLVQLELEELKPIPPELCVSEIIPEGVVLTGSAEGLALFVEKLRGQGVEVEMLSGISSASSINLAVKQQLEAGLSRIISKVKTASSKWLSCTTAKLDSVAHYTNAFRNVNMLKDLVNSLKRNSVLLKVGSSNFTAAYRTLHSLTLEGIPSKNNFTVLLEVLGSLYELGYNPEIMELYPKIQYPVSRGTPMISPLIKWDHTKEWFVPKFRSNEKAVNEENSYIIDLEDKNWDFVTCHNVDDRVLFPATGYLTIAWESLAMVRNLTMEEMPVVFQDVSFLRATILSRSKPRIELKVVIKNGSSDFKIFEGDNIIVSGRIYVPSDLARDSLNLSPPQPTVSKQCLPMIKEDFYKEMRVRGYNHTGEFRRVLKCDNDGNWGIISWDTTPEPKFKKWLTFIDSMLHMMMFDHKDKLHYLPTRIGLISIDPEYHLSHVQNFGEFPEVPVYCYSSCKVIRSGGIEIRSAKFSPVSKRKSKKEPTLEKYEFIPNRTRLSTAESVRVNMQIVDENVLEKAARIVEIIDNSTDETSRPLSPIIQQVFEDIRYVRVDITILSTDEMEDDFGIKVVRSKLSSEHDCTLIVGSRILQRPSIEKQALSAIRPGGFVLTREPLHFCPAEEELNEICIVTVHETPSEKLILFKKKSANDTFKAVEVSEASNADFDWLSNLQGALGTTSDVIIYSQNEPLNGVMGFVNCLRCEPGLTAARGVFIANEAPAFELSNPFYTEQLKKKLAMNVYKDSQWGTYRYLPIGEAERRECEHSFVSTTNQGGLSSLNWIQGNLCMDTALSNEEELIHVYFTGINFRDIMLASGRISANVFTNDRLKQETLLGLEFSGRNSTGERVFGISLKAGALSMLVKADKSFLWKIPESWSMEDAATVPAVYVTLLYSLFVRCAIKRGQSILVHAGSGGIGFAAIHLAIREGLTVFTTVSTQEKRDFLKTHYPQLLDQNIGNSRDTTFERMIMTQTRGRGVDIVLNCLSDEKLQTSVRCLAQGGNFLEIGKYDIIKNTELQLTLLSKEATFSGITLDSFDDAQPHTKHIISRLMQKFLESGAIKPLPRTVFKEEEIEQAFRFMASGKHMGKIVVTLREEEQEQLVIPSPKMIKALPRYRCDEDTVYVLVGGLGGFGLELADWLVVRGARRIVLSSSRGVKTGYQAYKIKTWIESGAFIFVSTSDVTSERGCEELISEANSLGEVAAIFNLAVVIRDAIFENQTPEKFQQSFAPKADAAHNLDKISRRLCKNLRDFVMFSSNSSGRGNAGQTNYGMANSTMERICERRKKDGLPAVAIEWGPILEVGLLTAIQEDGIELEVAGGLQQKISSCLEVLDIFLNQKNVIVSSLVIAEKRNSQKCFDNVVGLVANILSIKDLKVVSLHATLAELGMDSITKNEVKQVLEQKLGLMVTEEDVRNLTFTRLREIEEEIVASIGTNKVIEKEVENKVTDEVSSLAQNTSEEEEMMELPYVALFPRVDIPSNSPRAILFPGIEGVSNVMKPLAAQLKSHMTCLQYPYDSLDAKVEDYCVDNVIRDMADSYLGVVNSLVSKDNPFIFVAYSFGVIVALEIAAALEIKGYQGTILCIDGGPELVNNIITRIVDVSNEAVFQIKLLTWHMSLYMPMSKAKTYETRLQSCKNFEERISLVSEILDNDLPHSKAHFRKFLIALYKRSKCMATYKPAFEGLKSKISLYKPTCSIVSGMSYDYNLGPLCKDPVKVEMISGTHVSMLSSNNLANSLNDVLFASLNSSYASGLHKAAIERLTTSKNKHDEDLMEEEIALRNSQMAITNRQLKLEKRFRL